jgi:hypothetical protein
MKTIKSKERLGNILYTIASILLLISIYKKGADTEYRLLDIASWVTLMIAALYGIWITSIKKKDSLEK